MVHSDPAHSTSARFALPVAKLRFNVFLVTDEVVKKWHDMLPAMEALEAYLTA